jgi:hypothetical protein
MRFGRDNLVQLDNVEVVQTTVMMDFAGDLRRQGLGDLFDGASCPGPSVDSDVDSTERA